MRPEADPPARRCRASSAAAGPPVPRSRAGRRRSMPATAANGALRVVDQRPPAPVGLRVRHRARRRVKLEPDRSRRAPPAPTGPRRARPGATGAAGPGRPVVRVGAAIRRGQVRAEVAPVHDRRDDRRSPRALYHVSAKTERLHAGDGRASRSGSVITCRLLQIGPNGDDRARRRPAPTSATTAPERATLALEGLMYADDQRAGAAPAVQATATSRARRVEPTSRTPSCSPSRSAATPRRVELRSAVDRPVDRGARQAAVADHQRGLAAVGEGVAVEPAHPHAALAPVRAPPRPRPCRAGAAAPGAGPRRRRPRGTRAAPSSAATNRSRRSRYSRRVRRRCRSSSPLAISRAYARAVIAGPPESTAQRSCAISCGELRRRQRPPEPQRGRQRLRRRAEIDHPVGREPLQRPDRRPVIAVLGVVVVLEHDPTPREQRAPPLRRQHRPGRELVRGRDQHRVRVAARPARSRAHPPAHRPPPAPPTGSSPTSHPATGPPPPPSSRPAWPAPGTSATAPACTRSSPPAPSPPPPAPAPGTRSAPAAAPHPPADRRSRAPHRAPRRSPAAAPPPTPAAETPTDPAPSPVRSHLIGVRPFMFPRT